MATLKKELYQTLRRQGHSINEIANMFGVSKQAVSGLMRRQNKGGGKIQRFLRSLEIDKPVFVPTSTFTTTGLFECAKKMRIKIILRNIERGGVEGRWICRLK
jgi:predicted transcriptional regulator